MRMKTMMLWAAVAALAVGYAAGVRIDVRGSKNVRFREVTAQPPLSWRYFPQYRGTDRETSAIMLSSPPLAPEWRRFEFSFMPERDSRVTLSFHVQGIRRQVEPAVIDEIQVTGAVLKNGGFEVVKDGGPAHWHLGKHAKLLNGRHAAKGMNCMRITYRYGMASQQIRVPAGQLVTVSFLAKLADTDSAAENIVQEPQSPGGEK